MKLSKFITNLLTWSTKIGVLTTHFIKPKEFHQTLQQAENHELHKGPNIQFISETFKLWKEMCLEREERFKTSKNILTCKGLSTISLDWILACKFKMKVSSTIMLFRISKSLQVIKLLSMFLQESWIGARFTNQETEDTSHHHEHIQET